MGDSDLLPSDVTQKSQKELNPHPMKTYFKSHRGFILVLLGLALNLTLMLSTSAQTWSTNNPLNAARWSHTATLLSNGSVLISGGIVYNMNCDLHLTTG